ncbi:hypothetical protein GOV03_04505 [Candidatus Woesearchaeota archaeon]|nr:hypothetical protein [Candidatus Woesearchaeota archaeon]
MINLDCAGCKRNCCTFAFKKIFAALTPQEEVEFKDYSIKIKNEGGEISVLKKDSQGNCVL